MLSYIKNEIQSGLRRVTNSKKSHQKPGHEKKDICRKDETVISRVKADHALLNNGYLMENPPVPECELHHSHAMNVKYLSTDCVNLASLRLRCFDGSNPNTLKQVSGRNKVSSSTIGFLKESNIYNLPENKNEEKN